MLSSNSLSDAEKKAKKKQKKAAQKVQEEAKKGTKLPLKIWHRLTLHSLAAANNPSSSTNEDKGLEPTPLKDDDPSGTKLLDASGALERAWKLLSPLVALAQDNIEVQLEIYDVAVRRSEYSYYHSCVATSLTQSSGKYLQASKALKHAKSLDADHPGLHVRLVDFRKRGMSTKDCSRVFTSRKIQ